MTLFNVTSSLFPTPRRGSRVLFGKPRAVVGQASHLTAVLALVAAAGVSTNATAGRGYTPPPPVYRTPPVTARSMPRTAPNLGSVKLQKPLPATPGVAVSRSGSILSGGRVYQGAGIGKATGVSRDGRGVLFGRVPGGRLAARVQQFRIGQSKHAGATVIRPETKHGQPANPLASQKQTGLAKDHPHRHIELKRSALEDVFGPSRPATPRDQFNHAHDHGVVMNSARGQGE